jgi:predicted ATPase with chaperone activity
MSIKVTSIGLKGMEGYRVNVEVKALGGVESIVIVGLPDASVKESKDRITAFRQIIGHEQAKYALEVAGAGEHHLFMTGPPGVGKVC